MLADSTNGYCWDWKLYTGREGNTTEHGLAHRVVMDLVKHQRLTEKGYILFTDNFYSSPALLQNTALEHVELHEKTGGAFLRTSLALL